MLVPSVDITIFCRHLEPSMPYVAAFIAERVDDDPAPYYRGTQPYLASTRGTCTIVMPLGELTQYEATPGQGLYSVEVRLHEYNPRIPYDASTPAAIGTDDQPLSVILERETGDLGY